MASEPDGVLMDLTKSVGSRVFWECPNCGNTTATSPTKIAYCTACQGDADD